jgi:hypothetical protein
MRNAERGLSRGALGPQGVGLTPQSVRPASRSRYAICLGLATAATLLTAAGCESSTDATGAIAPVVVSMSSTAAPYYSSDELTIYWEQTPVTLPVRKGTGMEPNVSPYPSSPYLLTSDYLLQVNYTVTNLDNVSNNVWVTMNPWNQFVRYYPGITVVSDDETEPNWSGIWLPVVLPPMGRVQGTFTSADMTALATQLDVAMSIIIKGPIGDASGYTVADLINNDFANEFGYAGGDQLMQPYTPSVLAGMTGFDLGIQSNSPMNVALEIEIQLTDNSQSSTYPDGKFIPPGQTGTPAGEPAEELKIPGAVNM